MSCSYFSIFLAVPIRWPSPGRLARRPQERDSRQLTEGWAPRGTRTAPRHSRLDQPWAPSQGQLAPAAPSEGEPTASGVVCWERRPSRQLRVKGGPMDPVTAGSLGAEDVLTERTGYTPNSTGLLFWFCPCSPGKGRLPLAHPYPSPCWIPIAKGVSLLCSIAHLAGVPAPARKCSPAGEAGTSSRAPQHPPSKMHPASRCEVPRARPRAGPTLPVASGGAGEHDIGPTWTSSTSPVFFSPCHRRRSGTQTVRSAPRGLPPAALCAPRDRPPGAP